MRIVLTAVQHQADNVWCARMTMDGEAARLRIELHEPGYSCWIDDDDDPRERKGRLFENSREEHAIVALVREWSRGSAVPLPRTIDVEDIYVHWRKAGQRA